MTKGSDGAKIDDSSIKTKYEIDPHQKKIEREREGVSWNKENKKGVKFKQK